MRSCMGGLAATVSIAGVQPIRRLVDLSPAPHRASAMRNPADSDLLTICAGKWLGLRFPHDSEEFFSLARRSNGFTLAALPGNGAAREGMHGPPRVWRSRNWPSRD